MEILVVDDDAIVLEVMSLALEEKGHTVCTCASAHEALAALRSAIFPLIITDINMPGMDGIELIKQVFDEFGANCCEIMVCTGSGDIDTAVAALRAGAFDYMQKPINVTELILAVERCKKHQDLVAENKKLTHDMEEVVQASVAPLQSEIAKLKSKVSSIHGLNNFCAESESMQQIYRDCMIYHRNPESPVIIEGETGTGKEVIAKLIHYGDSGQTAPLIDINCAAISRDLFEAELFGYEAGAFTGAKAKGERGKIALADSGSLFLDEIGDMPPELQPKLLRVLQERIYFPVGGVVQQEVSCRLICATNLNLETEVQRGSFREDLYYRLNVGRIYIPPLRERREDILPLSEAFLRREAAKKKKSFERIGIETARLFIKYNWPGNVRQLENAIERAVLAFDGKELLPKHLWFINWGNDALPAPEGEGRIPFVHMPEEGLDLEGLVDRLVLQGLEKCGGNKTRAAEYLGMSRFALHRRLKSLVGDRVVSDDSA